MTVFDIMRSALFKKWIDASVFVEYRSHRYRSLHGSQKALIHGTLKNVASDMLVIYRTQGSHRHVPEYVPINCIMKAYAETERGERADHPFYTEPDNGNDL